MSSVMNKIADALTGHHANTNTNTHNTTTGTTTGAHTNLPAGNQAGGVGNNFAGTNYTQQNNGALKEGAQVRDTGLNSTASTMNKHSTTNPALGSETSTKSSHLGRDAALGAGAAGLGATALHHNNTHNSTLSSQPSSLSSSNTGSVGGTTNLGARTQQTQPQLGTTGAGLGRESAVGYDQSTDNAMTRSEEHLLVGKEKVNVGKAALNKYVTTEKVSTAVPIVRERAVLEREPITDANRDAALRGPDFKEAHYEVNLMEERAVAEKEVVPIERVRLRKEVDQAQQYVEAELRKEHIELVDPTRDAAIGGKSLNAVGTQQQQLGSDRRTAMDSTSQTANLTNSSRY